MRFTQISLKRKVIIGIALTILLISIVFIYNSIKKIKHERFVNAFENNMAKIMVSIDIYDIKNTLLTNNNKEIMIKVKKIIEDTKLSKSQKDSFSYISRKKEYQLMDKIFAKVSDWDNLTRFEKNRIVDHIIGQRIMYKEYLRNK
ncbi:hypothetical protein [Vallitalea guaymasensis]|uniref:Uncharacterized protein n=1 Tax=Vallitalea guaymasensis TaxID=1185412 RepID=A0A8J8MCZ8_9FIRM|nr:hypothetical protein [Vallitalea guaymasensis]QUH30420.1 hypothetical protein HYG85_16500 [Vallitalea guaymasensis]